MRGLPRQQTMWAARVLRSWASKSSRETFVVKNTEEEVFVVKKENSQNVCFVKKVEIVFLLFSSFFLEIIENLCRNSFLSKFLHEILFRFLLFSPLFSLLSFHFPFLSFFSFLFFVILSNFVLSFFLLALLQLWKEWNW